MSFLQRVTENQRRKILATNLPFKYQNDIEIIEPDANVDNDAKLIVGVDDQRENLTIKYPGNLGGGGLYINNPETPVLEIDTAGNVTIPSLNIEDVVFDDIETNIIKTKNTGTVVHESPSIFESTVNVQGDLDMEGNNITNCKELFVNFLNNYITSDICVYAPFDMQNNNIVRANTVDFNKMTANTNTWIDVESELRMNNVANLGSINMRDQIITNVGSMDFQTIPATDNTNTDLLTVDVSGNVEVRTVASLPSINPFDQDLNTSDSPTFTGININDLYEKSISNGISVRNNMNIIGGVDLILQDTADLRLFGTVPTSTSDDYLVLDTTNVRVRTNTWGNNFQEAQSLGVSSTTSLGGVVKLNLTTPTIPAGDYIISWYSEMASDNSAGRTEGRLDVDGAQQESVETPLMAVANAYTTFGGVIKRTLTNAVHTVDIRFRPRSTGIGTDTARIRSAHIQIWRI
jgi:hypothetical protein